MKKIMKKNLILKENIQQINFEKTNIIVKNFLK